MDVVLLGGALSLSVSMAPTCVLSHHHHQQQHPQQQLEEPSRRRRLSPLSVSLCLSFFLLALSVLEASPSSWLMFLDNRVVDSTDDGTSRDENEYLTVTFAYYLVLTALSIYILIICPCFCGIMIMERVLSRPDCDLLCCFSNLEKPWWLKFIVGLTSALYKFVLLILTLVYMVLQSCWGLVFRRATSIGISKRDSNNGKSLPVTTTGMDSNMTNSSNLLVSVGCLANSVLELCLVRGGSFFIGSLVGLAVTHGLLHWVAPFIIQPKSEGNTLALALSWMCAIGIVLSAFLNGFGSVSMPHSCLAGLYLDPIRPETVTKATVDLEKTQESLEIRRQQLKEIRLKPVTTVTPTSATNSSFSSRWGIKRPFRQSFSGIGEEVRQRRRKLLEEISFLEALVEEIKEDIQDMKYTQAMEAASRTTVGRIKSWLGVVFSVILLARLYFAAVAIWHHWYNRPLDTLGTTTGPSLKRDPVTTTLLWLLGHHMVTEKDYDELSQFISLLLTALLSFSQVRTFLRTVAAMHRRLNHLFCPARTISTRLTPRNDALVRSDSLSMVDDSAIPFQTRTGVYMHILASLMGSYFLACIVLTKMMVPWQYRSSFSGALGGFDAFVIQSDLINAMFAFSAVVSATTLAMLFGIQKQNALRHNVSWLDELSPSMSRDLDV